MRRIVLLLVLLQGFAAMTFAQAERKYIRAGNDAYEKGEYAVAMEKYDEARDENFDSFEAAFNLGDALYRKENYDSASKHFAILTRTETDKSHLSQAYHNLGNCFMQAEKWKESAESYKNALRNNPRDEDSRYNLAYALQKLKEQQQQDQEKKEKGDEENKDEQDQQEQEKEESEDGEKEKKEDEGEEGEEKKEEGEEGDEGDEEKKEEKQEGKDGEEGEEKEPQDQPKPEEQPDPNQMSKEDALRMLEALQDQEQDLQDDMQKKKVKSGKVMILKDW